MQYYVAPMEGITDSIYRRLHRQFFPGADRYYTPFFSPAIHRALTPRESRELPPADALGVPVVPQLLSKVPEDFIWMAGVCRDLGYSQVNLNLGCPSGTVTAKGKGAGMLREPDTLRQFLDSIFESTPLPLSVKTRLGFADREEFFTILEIYNQYPICVLIIHPRVRAAFYSGEVDREMFSYATAHSKAPLCYNGNLCAKSQAAEIPGVSAVMLGRGLIGDPGMLTPGGTSRETLSAFLEALLEEYSAAFGGSRNAMFRLKENWRYLLCLFEENPRLQKRLRKAADLQEYKAVTYEILHNVPMRSKLQPDW